MLVAAAQELSLSVLTRTTYSVLPDSEDARTGLTVVTVVPGSVVLLTVVAVCTAVVAAHGATAAAGCCAVDLTAAIADGHCAVAAPSLPSDTVTAVAWLSVSVRCMTIDPILSSRDQLAVVQCSQ